MMPTTSRSDKAPPPPLDLRATITGRAVAFACDLDRAWFDAHPDATAYRRPAVEGEWPLGVDLVDVVLVGPGLRARIPVGAP